MVHCMVEIRTIIRRRIRVIEKYIETIKKDYGEMSKQSDFNVYYNRILNDINTLTDEVGKYDYFDFQNKELMVNIIVKLTNICCNKEGDLIKIISNICK